MTEQLPKNFEKQTGMQFGTKMLTFSFPDNYNFQYFFDEISWMKYPLYVNDHSMNVYILWRSKSGRSYEFDAEDVDCNDVEFWFEGLEPKVYYELINPPFKVPFKLKNLSYALEINRLHMQAEYVLTVKENVPAQKEIETLIADFIGDYNTKSENKDRKYGVIHNCWFKEEGNNIIADIDTGFTGPYFTKKFLLWLSSLGYFEKVEIS